MFNENNYSPPIFLISMFFVPSLVCSDYPYEKNGSILGGKCFARVCKADGNVGSISARKSHICYID